MLGSSGMDRLRSTAATVGTPFGGETRPNRPGARIAGVSRPVLRVRKSGALLIAALIALVGTVPLAGMRWSTAPLLLIPLAVLIWALRAGTDVFPDHLRVRALLGSADVPWDQIDELVPDERGRVSARLTGGTMLRLTGVTTANLQAVLAAGGQPVSSPPPPD
jgi:Bacterial PH domain